MATFALVPGGGGDPWEWHRLVPELETRGYEALAIGLPAEDDGAGWTDYADAVVSVVGERRDVVMVAASMGGFTAPIACARRSVELLVLLNAMIPVPGETFNAWWANTNSAEARREYHASIGLTPAEADDDAAIYYHDLPLELEREHAVVAAGQHARGDIGPVLELQRRIAQDRLGLEVDEIDGGHMLALGNPGGLADRLEVHLRESRRHD